MDAENRKTNRRGKITSLRQRQGATRRVAMFAYDGAQSLDVCGPMEVFSAATRLRLDADPAAPPAYALELLAPRAGVITLSSGLKLTPDRAYTDWSRPVDTLVLAGGDVVDVAGDERILQWVRSAARQVRRLVSVCSGAFILAQAGLLDGRRATTHWVATEILARRYPKIEVDPDAIFVRDGRIYTSAGVTAGIDLALALVEEDLGHETALAVARHLVVFLKRPGGQSQFSSHLAAQAVAPGPLKGLPDWILAHLDADLSVEQLAARAAMSPRNFARVFLRETRVTPAKFIEQARIDAARRQLEDDGLSLEEVAARCGFGSAGHMRRTFLRHLRIVPQDYRRRFRHEPPRLAVGAR